MSNLNLSFSVVSSGLRRFAVDGSIHVMARWVLDFAISPEKQRWLQGEVSRLGLADGDLEESFIRSGGHGGQNVNKVSTCVVLAHAASGLMVRMQRERSQILNRFLARRLLLEKIAEQREGEKSAHRQEIEKIRRQKRKRSKRAKEKMLDAKNRQSGKKALRRRPGLED